MPPTGAKRDYFIYAKYLENGSECCKEIFILLFFNTCAKRFEIENWRMTTSRQFIYIHHVNLHQNNDFLIIIKSSCLERMGI